MPIAESRAHIHATPQALFALTQDSSRRRSWDPFTKALVYQDGAEAPAVGVRVAVRSWLGSRMLVEYVSFQPGQCAAIRMVAGPGLLRSFAGSWRFLPQADGMTEVQFRYTLSARWRWLDGLLQRYFQFETRRRLIALKHRIEHA
ncbi:type II toxin-antitoxin system RatA family toxin [Chitinolyticbacter meiyuanensis]|uniref:type II toxin-antitoxin system RatA family toxin n=1 Tax=Chitinolyticbacter meiyuanensis TaxID=682798 RepID=UPI0011E5A49A|nr:SRPBCC family protein [Chitinolyticbacter meiyuanensis]